MTSDWPWLKLSDVLVPQSNRKLLRQGWSPQCLAHPAESQKWGVLKTTAIQAGSYVPIHNKELPDFLEPRPQIEVQAGDLLMTCAGPRARCGVPTLVRHTPERLMMSGKMYRFRPNDRLDPRFLEFWLLSPTAQKLIDAMKTGISDSGLNLTHNRFLELQVPVPSRDEQVRLVDLLEDHLSRLDAADQGLVLSLAKLRRLRERTIVHAITGQDASQRVDPELRDAGTSDGDLLSLPLGWEWSRLGDVADVVGGITKDAKKQSDPSFVEVPYLRVANVQRGHLRLDVVTKIRADAAKVKSLRLEAGDVLLNEGGDRDKLARGWVWEGQIEDCIHQNHVFRARLRESRLNPYFLSWTTNTLGGRWAERNGKQSVNLASISLRMIKHMPVIVPPPGEAERIVAALSDQLGSYERLRWSLESTRERGDALRRSILSAAFSGEMSDAPPVMSGSDVIEDLERV